MLKLFERQIKKHFGDSASIPEDLRVFVETVRETYRQADEDRKMLERSLELSSKELIEINENLEDLVKERTLELTRANQSLKREIQERIRTEKSLSNKNRELKEKKEHLKQTTQMLIQSEKMSAIGIMVAGVAHELNNPLTAIINFIEMSLKVTSEDDKRHKYLQIAEEATSRCISIIENLLIFSYNGNQTNELRRVCCSEILDKVLELINFRIVKHNINIIEQIDDDKLEIWIKPTHIMQVFSNLLSNAIDALERSDGKDVKIYIKHKGDNIEITFEDNGDGIPKEKIDKIFDPFFTTKPVGKGTGLGLSISKHIINEHNGEIICESEVGVGTKFIITLPADQDKSLQINNASHSSLSHNF
ncbi:MAG: HAMP domain-containing sensor histidine kinase [Deltaproteobacteria bacterium]